jgi:hypothetical protein
VAKVKPCGCAAAQVAAPALEPGISPHAMLDMFSTAFFVVLTT